MLCVQSPPIRAAIPWEGFNQKRLIGKAKLDDARCARLASASGIGRISSDRISARRKASGAGFCRCSICSTLRTLANLRAILIEIDADRNASRTISRRPSIVVGAGGIRQTAGNAWHCSRLDDISILIHRKAIFEHGLGGCRGDRPHRHHHQADNTE